MLTVHPRAEIRRIQTHLVELGNWHSVVPPFLKRVSELELPRPQYGSARKVRIKFLYLISALLAAGR